ncbi:KICSTOR complex protein szt2 [Entophlyctis sp. JEL0112]|nr:KICSTOR complex protein szt2 [Entophlyctis sp. JEL0112]
MEATVKFTSLILRAIAISIGMKMQKLSIKLHRISREWKPAGWVLTVADFYGVGLMTPKLIGEFGKRRVANWGTAIDMIYSTAVALLWRSDSTAPYASLSTRADKQNWILKHMMRPMSTVQLLSVREFKALLVESKLNTQDPYFRILDLSTKKNYFDWDSGFMQMVPSMMGDSSSKPTALNSSSVATEHHLDESNLLFRITPDTRIYSCSEKYRVSIVVDVSASMRIVDSSFDELNRVLVPLCFETQVFILLCNCLDGICRPFAVKNSITGELIEVSPQIYVTILTKAGASMGYRPDISPRAHDYISKHPVHVLLQDVQVTQNNLFSVTEILYDRMNQYENEIISLKHLDNEMNETASSLLNVSKVSTNYPIQLNSLEHGLLALRLLPRDCSPVLIVLSDGVSMSPMKGEFLYRDVCRRLAKEIVNVTIIQVGSSFGFNPGVNFGFVPDNEALRFLARACFGKFIYSSDCNYLEPIARRADRETATDSSTSNPNFYHRYILIRTTNLSKSKNLKAISVGDERPVDTPRVRLVDVNLRVSETTDVETLRRESLFPWHPHSLPPMIDEILYGHKDYNVDSRDLSSLIKCRLLEGFELKSIHIGSNASNINKAARKSSVNRGLDQKISKGEKVEIILLRPWLPNVTIQYTIKAKFILDSGDSNKSFLSSVVSDKPLRIELNIRTTRTFALAFVNVENSDAKSDSLVKLHNYMRILTRGIQESDGLLNLLVSFKSSLQSLPRADSRAFQSFSSFPNIWSASPDQGGFWNGMSQFIINKAASFDEWDRDIILRSSNPSRALTDINSGLPSSMHFSPTNGSGKSLQISETAHGRNRLPSALIRLMQTIGSPLWSSFVLNRTTFGKFYPDSEDGLNATGFGILRIVYETDWLVSLRMLFYNVPLEGRCHMGDQLCQVVQSIQFTSNNSGQKSDLLYSPICICEKPIRRMLVRYQFATVTESSDTSAQSPTVSVKQNQEASAQEKVMQSAVQANLISSVGPRSFLRTHRWIWFSDITLPEIITSGGNTGMLSKSESNIPQLSLLDLSLYLLYFSRLESGYLLISHLPDSVTMYREISLTKPVLDDTNESADKYRKVVCGLQFIILIDRAQRTIVTEIWAEPIIEGSGLSPINFSETNVDELFKEEHESHAQSIMENDSRLFNQLYTFDSIRSLGKTQSVLAGNIDDPAAPVVEEINQPGVFCRIMRTDFFLESVLQNSDFYCVTFTPPEISPEDAIHSNSENLSSKRMQDGSGSSLNPINSKELIERVDETSVSTHLCESKAVNSVCDVPLVDVKSLASSSQMRIVLNRFFHAALVSVSDGELDIQVRNSKLPRIGYTSVPGKSEKPVTVGTSELDPNFMEHITNVVATYFGHLNIFTPSFNDCACFVKIRNPEQFLVAFVPKLNSVAIDKVHFLVTVVQCNRSRIHGNDSGRTNLALNGFEECKDKGKSKNFRWDFQGSENVSSLNDGTLLFSGDTRNIQNSVDDNLNSSESVDYADMFLVSISNAFSISHCQSTYAALLQNINVSAKDLDKALASCSEISVDIDLTNFLNVLTLRHKTMAFDDCKVPVTSIPTSYVISNMSCETAETISMDFTPLEIGSETNPFSTPDGTVAIFRLTCLCLLKPRKFDGQSEDNNEVYSRALDDKRLILDDAEGGCKAAFYSTVTALNQILEDEVINCLLDRPFAPKFLSFTSEFISKCLNNRHQNNGHFMERVGMASAVYDFPLVFVKELPQTSMIINEFRKSRPPDLAVSIDHIHDSFVISGDAQWAADRYKHDKLPEFLDGIHKSETQNYSNDEEISYAGVATASIKLRLRLCEKNWIRLSFAKSVFRIWQFSCFTPRQEQIALLAWVVESVQESCERVNKFLLLQQLHADLRATKYLIARLPFDASSDEEDSDDESQQLEMFHPNQFACACVFSRQFPLHWRVKPYSALSALSSDSFSIFAITNRKNMFVVEADNSVWYFKLSVREIEIEGLPNDISSPYLDDAGEPSKDPGSPLLSRFRAPNTSAHRECSLILEFFGIDVPSANITSKFEAIIESKLMSMTQIEISVHIARNVASVDKSAKLYQADVDFVLPPTRMPNCRQYFKIPENLSSHLKFFSHLRQAMLTNLNPLNSNEVVSALDRFYSNSYGLRTSESGLALLYSCLNPRAASKLETSIGVGIAAVCICILGEDRKVVSNLIHEQPVEASNCNELYRILQESPHELRISGYDSCLHDSSKFFVAVDVWLHGPINGEALMDFVFKGFVDSIMEFITEVLIDVSLKSLSSRPLTDLVMPNVLEATMAIHLQRNQKINPSFGDFFDRLLHHLTISASLKSSFVEELNSPINLFNRAVDEFALEVRELLIELSPSLAPIMVSKERNMFGSVYLEVFEPKSIGSNGGEGELREVLVVAGISVLDDIFRQTFHSSLPTGRLDEISQSSLQIGSKSSSGSRLMPVRLKSRQLSNSSNSVLGSNSPKGFLLMSIRSDHISVFTHSIPKSLQEDFFNYILRMLSWNNINTQYSGISHPGQPKNPPKMPKNTPTSDYSSSFRGIGGLGAAMKHIEAHMGMNESDISNASHESNQYADADVLQKNAVAFLDAYIRKIFLNGSESFGGVSMPQSMARPGHAQARHYEEPSPSTNFSPADLAAVLRSVRLHYVKFPIFFTAGVSVQSHERDESRIQILQNWFRDFVSKLMWEYCNYLTSQKGFEKLKESSKPKIANDWASNPKYRISLKIDIDVEPVYLVKFMEGSMFILQVGVEGICAAVNLYMLKQPLTAKINPDGEVSEKQFRNDCALNKGSLHLHSFMYDFHIRYFQRMLDESKSSPVDIVTAMRTFEKENNSRSVFARSWMLSGQCFVDIQNMPPTLFQYILKNPSLYGFNPVYFQSTPTACFMTSDSPKFSKSRIGDTKILQYKYSIIIYLEIPSAFVSGHQFPSSNSSTGTQGGLNLKYFLLVADQKEKFPLSDEVQTPSFVNYDPLNVYIADTCYLRDIVKFAERRIHGLIEDVRFPYVNNISHVHRHRPFVIMIAIVCGDKFMGKRIRLD